MEARRDAFRARLHAGGQGRHQFQPRGRQKIGEAEFGGRPGQSSQEKRFGFRLGDAGELGAIAVQQPEAAGAAALGVDGEVPAALNWSISRWMVRTETSNSAASAVALMRPRVCSSIRIDKRRLANIF